MNFTSRHCVPELMDQPGLDKQLHRQALDGLRRVNRISATSSIFWPTIETLAKQRNDRPLSVLDVACGGGDVAVSLAQRAKRVGIKMKIDGCDISSVAVQHAQQQAAGSEVDASFFQHDVLADQFPQEYDVLTCSLFLHHLNETDAITLMQKMSATAGKLVLIDDLRRTRFGFFLAWAGCRLLSRSPIVHHDGPQSVVAAFSDSEARELAKQAGMGDVTMSRHWPQRFLLTWRRA
ncbi:MAG: methyltransferase domain-containing protein [Planctomycetaceae bacterium]|nr:methyltransferase domain-containing protein [Planctomycetaceae bacterium]